MLPLCQCPALDLHALCPLETQPACLPVCVWLSEDLHLAPPQMQALTLTLTTNLMPVCCSACRGYYRCEPPSSAWYFTCAGSLVFNEVRLSRLGCCMYHRMHTSMYAQTKQQRLTYSCVSLGRATVVP
jgi:hypothetical protein